ncbi:MAG: hypothetical protein HYZ29_35995 [Myxococcales bacterium]|nr:hypothetical protein [Myxococcales bacterium]
MEMFRECGWPAFAVLGLGVLSVLLAMVALGVAIARPRVGLVLGCVALAVSCSVPGVGVGGTTLGKSTVDAALSGASVAPEQRERIRAQGYQEAGQCTSLGVGFGALPWVLSVAAVAVGGLRRRAQPQ